MQDRLRELERTVAEIQQRLQRLEDRFEVRRERQSEIPVGAAFAPPIEASTATKAPRSAGAMLGRLLQLIGRTCLVLGGGFLIRALSDGRVLSLGVGIALALALATVSLAFSYRAARVPDKLSAAFHGLTAALIAYPLAYETCTRLGAISIGTAAAVVTGITLMLLFVAWQHRISALAWLGVAFGLGTTLALMQAAGLTSELIFVLLLLAAATLWLAESRSWNGPRWPATLLLDVVVLRAVFSSAYDRGTVGVLGGFVFSMLVVLLTLAALADWTFARNRKVTAFHVVQTFAGSSIGVAAVLHASAAYHWNTAIAGWVALALSAAALFVAVYVVPRRNLARSDHWFYLATSAGLLFVGGALAASDELRGLLWAVVGALVAALGHRLHRLSLSAYAAVFIWAGATSSSLLNTLSDAFIGGGQGWRTPGVDAVVVLGLALATYWVIATTQSEAKMPPAVARLPASATLFLCAIGFAALVVHAERAALGAHGSDHAFIAMARSLALIAVAVSLAVANRKLHWVELAWIAYAILVSGGIKLVVEDLPNGRALTLVIAFAAYGIGLIAIQKLLRPLVEIAYQTGAPLSATRRP